MSEPFGVGAPTWDARQLDDFEIFGKLGQGGSATVYRARHRLVQQECALKIWRGPLTPHQRQRFEQECLLQYKLRQHPNIVRLYWAQAVEDQPPWLATRLYQESLRQRLRRLPALTPNDAWQITEDLLAGLSAVHAQGHLHRDVKPENVMLADGRAALGDFGIAMRVDALTKDAAAGTERYIAPELFDGRQQPTKRSDVFSAAVTIRELFPPPRPAALRMLLDEAASEQPARRPADARELRRKLVAARTRRSQTRLLATVLIVAALLTGTIAALRQTHLLDRGSGAPDAAVSPQPPAGSISSTGPSATATAEVSSGPTISACAVGVAAGSPLNFSADLVTSRPNVARLTRNGADFRVDFPGQYDWAGLFLVLPKGSCRYRLTLDARIVEPEGQMGDQQGWGYGLGPCNVWSSDQPFGFSMQVAFFQDGGGARSNSGVFTNPEVNNGTSVDTPADYDWHRWSVDVADGRVSIGREYGAVVVTTGQVSGARGLPDTCADAGVFLRVFNGSAEFRSIAVTAL